LVGDAVQGAGPAFGLQHAEEIEEEVATRVDQALE